MFKIYSPDGSAFFSGMPASWGFLPQDSRSFITYAIRHWKGTAAGEVFDLGARSFQVTVVKQQLQTAR